MAVVLGASYGHNGSACIVKDGKILVALSSERLSRHKASHGVTEELIDYLFSSVNMGPEDIDCIALGDWHSDFAFHDIQVMQNGEPIPCLWNTVYDNTTVRLEASLWGRTYPAYHIGHQKSHAASAYYTSPFDEAYCFSMDACGAKHKNNSLVSYGYGNKFWSLYCPWLHVGVAYGFFTEWLGIGTQIFKAGATMALAGYGEVLPKVRDNLASYVNGCFLSEDRDYYQWYIGLWRDLTGSPDHLKPEDSDSKRAMDIAATIQFIFSHAVLQCVNNIDADGVKNLCLSGGSMLNCTANSFVLQHGQFDNVHLFPGCGDEGLNIGTALYVAHHILGEPRQKYTDGEVCFLGPAKKTVEPDYAYLAKEIADGKIVAWCNGRAEYGPRALGNRSLLADPRDEKNLEKINFEIKHREWYRPLAPVVMEEHASDWFDFPTKSPFMLFTMQIKDPSKIPAVNHVDNSARIQTVSEKSNPHYYRLIKAFYDITGVPVLVNTSLNVNGEPMVESDEDALRFFNNSDLVDILVLHGKVLKK
jgi:carbamoyltransferase